MHFYGYTVEVLLSIGFFMLKDLEKMEIEFVSLVDQKELCVARLMAQSYPLFQ